MFGSRRIEELEYQVTCLRYDLDVLTEKLVEKGILEPERKPPPIRPNPRLTRKVPRC